MSNTQLPPNIAEIVNTICNTINSPTTAYHEYGNKIGKIIKDIHELISEIKSMPEDTLLPALIDSVEECITLSISASLAKRNGFGRFYSAYWIFAKHSLELDNSLDNSLSKSIVTTPMVMELVWCLSLLQNLYEEIGTRSTLDSLMTSFIDTIEHILKTYDIDQLSKFMAALRLSKLELNTKAAVMIAVNNCQHNLSNGGAPTIVDVTDNVDWTTKIPSTKAIDESVLTDIYKSIESCENQLTHLKSLLTKLVSKT